MECINASQWKTKQSIGETSYYVGRYPGTTPSTWRACHGAFAYLHHDLATCALTASRDHFGLEPFYYYLDRERFIFGSTVPDILKHLDEHPSFNFDRILNECFSVDQVLSPTYSDETFLKNISRVEPGHSLKIYKNKIVKQSFWQLDPEAPSIIYKDERDYLAHFSFLLDAAVNEQMEEGENLGAELSGGLDSSAILVSCHRQGLNPTLFSHIAPAKSGLIDDQEQARCVMEKLKFKNVHYLDAEQFDPLSVFHELSSLFAGAPPYIFFMLANNVHQAVVKEGCTTLLSGFGGDECVSSYARNNSFYPELLRSRRFRLAWREMVLQLQKNSSASPSALTVLYQLARYAHPKLFKLYLKRNSRSARSVVRGYPYFPSVRHFEHAQLQGSLSRHVRMRVEYSAVLARYMGFQYRYPMLHPPLVEFCFSLPISQKRNLGMGRSLIRRYLAEYLPPLVSDHASKRGEIVPATRFKFNRYLEEGRFKDAFSELPFEEEIKKIALTQVQPLARILAYMFKCYGQKQGINFRPQLDRISSMHSLKSLDGLFTRVETG